LGKYKHSQSKNKFFTQIFRAIAWHRPVQYLQVLFYSNLERTGEKIHFTAPEMCTYWYKFCFSDMFFLLFSWRASSPSPFLSSVKHRNFTIISFITKY